MDKLVSLKRTSFQTYNRFSDRNKRTFIEGHRGVNKEMPENTMLSFERGIELGLDSLEFDIWLTKDEVPVVIHGGDLGEIHHTTNGEGKVNDFTLRELLRFDAGQGESVPTLESVISLCKGKIFMNIEIKDKNHQLCFKKVLDLINMYDIKKQSAISSFQHEYYSQIANIQELEDIEFGFLYDTTEDMKVTFGYDNRPKSTMNVWYKEITPEFVQLAHSKGLGVHVWFCLADIETDEIIKYMFECGIDVYCTNNPRRVMEIRNELYP